ncbi:MAG: hypothetical protein KF819_32980 [Labilithrix sp.]|nr:hypothetical protein [Labilithrix sp.]
MAREFVRLVAPAILLAAVFASGPASAEDDPRARREKEGAAGLERFRAECQEPVANGQPLRASGCDAIALDAARAFREARLAARAIGTYRSLIAFDTTAKLSSPLAIEAAFELGESYQSVALYEQAADWYERYATLRPTSARAETALSDAMILRLGLGQEEAATRDAQTFAKLYGATRPVPALRVAFALASHHADGEQWSKARSVLAGAGGVERAPLDLRIRVHALLAKIHARAAGARSPLAAQEHARVRALGSDARAVEEAIAKEYADEEEGARMRRLAHVLVAVGEAVVFAADERRLAEVESVRLPAYDGPVDTASVVRYVQTTMKEWSAKKMAAIAGVEAEYVKVFEIRPVPPPGSVVAAASRVAMMWADFADALGRAPTPPAWKKDPALARAYARALDAVVEPIRSQRAKPAAKKCIDLSVKYQYRDARTHDCERWLARTFGAEFHLVDEMIPALRPGPVSAAPPLAYDGTPRRF